MSRVLKLEVLAELEKNQPHVTLPSFEMHKAVVKALAAWSAANPSQHDMNGLRYWRTGLKELVPLADLGDMFNPHLCGRICRSFQLVSKRENDGYKVAWSDKQLSILLKAFPLRKEVKK